MERDNPASVDMPSSHTRPYRRRFGVRLWVLAVVLVLVWVSLLVDPHVGPLLLSLLGAFGVSLGVIGSAMGLGLLGFGVFAGIVRFARWLRGLSQWPDE
jgi:hypothetical protein